MAAATAAAVEATVAAAATAAEATARAGSAPAAAAATAPAPVEAASAAAAWEAAAAAETAAAPPSITRSLSSQLGSDEAMEGCLQRCDAATLRLLKGVSRAWLRRVRLALHSSAWRREQLVDRTGQP